MNPSEPGFPAESAVIEQVVMARALDVTRAAYQEATARAGMLRGKIEEVHAYAEAQLAALDSDHGRGR